MVEPKDSKCEYEWQQDLCVCGLPGLVLAAAVSFTGWVALTPGFKVMGHMMDVFLGGLAVQS